VTFSYDAYEEKVRPDSNEWGMILYQSTVFSDPVKAIMDAPAIVVGGGNTWMLLNA
jgi:dipeptidase E